MHTDLRFLRKYWKGNKRSFLTILLAIIFLAAMATTSLLLERTDIRRELHARYDVDGAFDFEYLAVDSDTIDYLYDHKAVEDVGEIYCIGKIKYADTSATVGSFKNKTAAKLAHYHVSEGRLPENKGEIALTRDIYNTFSPFTEIGGKITLPIYGAGDIIIDESERTLVGIVDETSRDTFENSVHSNGSEYYDPRILLSYEEASNYSNGYTNIMLGLKNGDAFALYKPTDEELENPRYPDIEELFTEMFQRKYYLSGTGKSIAVQQIGRADNPDDIAISSKTEMIRYIAVFAIVITVISLLCSISIVMKKRMESLRLMRCIGYSKARIYRMMLFEAFSIFVIGTVIGILVGIAAYEGFYAVQTQFFGLSEYRGYTAEWVVCRKTSSPIITAIATTGLSVLISYAVVLIRLNKEIGIVKPEFQKKYFGRITSCASAVRRVLSQGIIGIMQIIALVCVLFATTLGYVYCIKDGKGASVVSQTTGGTGYMMNNNVYEVEQGIDLDKLGGDCYLYVQGGIAHAQYLSPQTSSGMSHKNITELYNNGAENVYCWSNPFMLMTSVGNGENQVLVSNPLSISDCEKFGFEPQTVSALPIILMNDNTFSKLLDVCEGDANSEKAVWISIFGDGSEFEIGEEITVYSARSDATGYMPEEIVTKKMNISDCVKADRDALEKNDFLCSILGDYRYYPGFLVISGEYTEKAGIFDTTYDKIVFYADNNEEKMKNILASAVRAEMKLGSKNRFDMHDKHIYNLANDYATIVFLFIFLFVIYIVGYCNILKLRLKQKAPTLSIMRCMGLPKHKLSGYLIIDSLKIPLISTALTAGLFTVFRRMMTSKYNRYCSLNEKWIELHETATTEKLDGIRDQMAELRNKYMLTDEMWIPDWIIPFAILAAAICIVSVLCILILPRKSITPNLAEAVTSKDQE